MREMEVDRGGRVLRARDAGDPSGPAVMYFHGTPGSRLDLSFDLGAARCPVVLWYGSDDKLAPPEYGRYLAQHLPQAQLVMRDGEGHMGLFEHLGEILAELTRPGRVFS